MRKSSLVLAAVLVLTLVLGLPQAYAEKTRPLIGIIQIVQHGALDAAREGFLKTLSDAGYQDGVNMTVDYRNAQGDQATLSSIADYFVSEQADLVLAIATPSALAIAGKTETIPILGTAITDYEAARLVQSNEAPGYNVTGTTDMVSVAEQIAMIPRLLPTAETVGLIYTSSEVNSQIQIDLAKAEIEKLGLKWTEVTVNSANDVQQAVNSIMPGIDALYIPTDNTLASAMPLVYEASLAHRVPVVAGEANMVRQGGHFTLAIDYYKLGEQTGEMALRVLRDGASVAEMPVESQVGQTYFINKTATDELGIVIPEDLLPYAEEVDMVGN
ncbi:MAG TPA: ABC transporter substrate-binding protein [Candidatus Limnocylindria bacterium]|nr:ABC transporter substrate-binding protein [Candidatus Limnocylindria bacterium]